MRRLFMLALITSVACAADVKLGVTPYRDEKMPRHAYLRRETAPVRVRVTNPQKEQAQVAGRLALTLGDETLLTRELAFAVPAEGAGETTVEIPLRDLKMARYALKAQCKVAGAEYNAESPLYVCPEPDREGLVLGIWWENAYKRQGNEDLLAKLDELGMTHVQVMPPYPELLDACLWRGMGLLHIQQGDAASMGFKAPAAEMYRLNASGKPYLNNGEFKDPVVGLANVDWQRATARSLGQIVARLAAHPAYDPRLCTSDDFWRRTGLDYNEWNVRRFREKYGIQAPRPKEALESDFPLRVARAKGVIPDNDPWVLWLRFNAQDVLGNYNRLQADAVREATGGKGKIGSVCGGGEGAWGFVPYVDIASGQWPPYNFGASGFSMLCCYNYNLYRFPALTQMWWYELARMGNRDLEQFVMPETLGLRKTGHLQNCYLYMASGLDGLAYFIYEWSSPAALEALREVGPVMRRYRKLIGALKPAPRTVGLLMPFENCCFNSLYPVEAQYAFCNLSMAQAEVEPVWPEELPARMKQYRVIVLHNVDWLTESNLKILKDYIAGGGAVLCDSLTEVEVPGAVRLDFPLAGNDRKSAYGDLAQVAKVKAALEGRVRPAAWSDDPHLLVRRFQTGGVNYLWVINLMTHQQDLDHLPEPGKERETPPLPAYADFDKREYTGVVHVQAEACAVYDVLRGKRIASERAGDTLALPVTMRTWQGCLLALYPAEPTAVRVEAPRQAAPGEAARISVTVVSENAPLRANLPLEIEVLEPGGRRSEEYSHTALAGAGLYKFPIPLARNDAIGLWRITVRELSSGLEGSVDFKVAKQ